MPSITNNLRVATMLVGALAVGFNINALSGRVRVDTVRYVGLSNSLMLLAVGLALGWVSLTVRRAGETSLRGAVDKAPTAVLAMLALAYLVMALVNFGDILRVGKCVSQFASVRDRRLKCFLLRDAAPLYVPDPRHWP
jgi:hypothetical protein